jgi:RNA ligase
MKLKEYLDIDHLHEMIEAKMVVLNYHPNGYLRILNYSKECQGERVWNDTTEKCRGLIVDSNDNIVARPFPKFYNYEEYEDPSVIPDLPFDIYEKLDGSLGILYWIGGIPYIATRGSFTSDQAIHATEILHSKLKHAWSKLDKRKTYLFEIIYPEDLHVITYKDVDNIFLLAVIDTDTGVEETPYNYKGVFSVAEHYGCRDWREIRNLINGDNREGFVVRFSNGFRIKLKYQE